MLYSHSIVVSVVAFASMMAATSAQVTYNGTCAPNLTNVTYAGATPLLSLIKIWNGVYPCRTVNVSTTGGGNELAAVRVCGTSNISRFSPVDMSGMVRYAFLHEVLPKEPDALMVSGQGRCNATAGNTTWREVREIEVGTLALSVAVASAGPAKDCIDAIGGLTVAQLNWIFTNLTATPNTTVAPNYQNPARGGPAQSRYWSDLSSDPKCQAVEIVLHGGTAFSTSMTYFESLVGIKYPLAKVDISRGVFTSTDPAVLADQIATSPNGIGFLFYHSTVETNTRLHGISLKTGTIGGSYVAPTLSGVRFGGNYPLLFPLTVYVHYSTVINNTDTSTTITAPRLAQVRDFLHFILSYYGSAPEDFGNGYASLDTQRRRLMLCRLEYTEYCDSTSAPAATPMSLASLAPTNAPVGSSSTLAPAIVPAPVKTPTRAPVKSAVLPAPVSALRPPAPTAAPQEPERPVMSALFAPLGNLFANLPKLPNLSDLPSLSELLCPPEFIQELTGISC